MHRRIYIKVPYKARCRLCNKKFKGKKGQQFCSPKHRQEYYKIKLVPTGIAKIVKTPEIRAMSEYMLTIDLMKKGYIVFKPMARNSVVNFLALKNEKVYKIDIITGRYNEKTGKLHYPKVRCRTKIIAVVTLNDNKVHYLNKF